MQHDEIKAQIIEKIFDIYDPEIPVNLYDLGLIYSIDCKDESDCLKCIVTMTLTSATCPVSEVLLNQIYDIGSLIDSSGKTKVVPNLVFNPPWSNDMMSDDA